MQAAPAERAEGALTSRPLPEGAEEVISEAAQRQALTLTLYQRGAALVRETREIGLPEGAARLILRGVPAGLDPGSLRLSSSHQPQVQGLSYTAGELDEERLLQAHLGGTIRFRPEPDAPWQEGRLRAFDEAHLILERDGSLHTLPRSERLALAFPEPTATLHGSPTVALALNSERGGTRPLTLAYRSDGLNWQAGYQLYAPQDGTPAQLEGYAQVDNRTGVDLPQASLRFVAADLAEAPRPRALSLAGAEAATDTLAGFPRFTLERRHDLIAGRSHRFRLFTTEPADLRHFHRIQGDAGAEPEEEQRLPAQRYAAWTARQDLPPGRVTLHEEATEHEGAAEATEPVGEGKLPGTASGDQATVGLGPAFAVEARRELQERRGLEDKAGFEAAWRITLRNRSDTATVVAVHERLPGDWELLASSAEPEQRRAREIVWRYTLEPGEDTEWTYRARVEQEDA
ncbi:MAG: DUF4139 domain-containing protein [Halorhodospira sp.]